MICVWLTRLPPLLVNLNLRIGGASLYTKSGTDAVLATQTIASGQNFSAIYRASAAYLSPRLAHKGSIFILASNKSNYLSLNLEHRRPIAYIVSSLTPMS